MATQIDPVMVEFRKGQMSWTGDCWQGSFEEVVQPWWLVGTPIGKRVRNGGGFFGGDRRGPTITIFGNYNSAAWNAAVYMKDHGCDLDSYQLSWCMAGSTEHDKKWSVDDFGGLRNRIAEAAHILRCAPFLNLQIRPFAVTHWTTIFSGSIPLIWSR